MNILQYAKSPYLLQHADNPVNWQIWESDILRKAQQNHRLLIISIGYAACHWCHVMEHECFQDTEVAEVMNAYYTSIKIDREEHPEVDAVYMKALQIMTRQGGWPLNIVALPDGRPVWGATFVKKEQWIDVLLQLQLLFEKEPERLYEYAQKLHENIKLISEVDTSPFSPSFILKDLIAKWQLSFDTEYGGYQRVPKFMMPTNLDYLQAYGHLTKDQSILTHVDTTLTRMAWGGLFDTIYGGFSRYAVDEKWHIPHFEKMLYDNAQLLRTYTDAYKRTGKALYKEVVEKTVLFIENTFKSPTGGYYSSLDADSVDYNGHLHEGAFYSWTKAELKELLKEDFNLFAEVFTITIRNVWENNLYVLIQSEQLEKIAEKNGISVETIKIKKKQWEQLLFHYREKRAKPRLDDKILTSWNALLLSGYLHANSILKNEGLEASIRELSLFINSRLTQPDGKLGHAYKEGIYLNGLLEDYAFSIQAYLDYYRFTSIKNYIEIAKSYMQWAFDLYYDTDKRLFKAHENDPFILASHYEVEDNVMPATNSVMCSNLKMLAYLTGNSYYEKVAADMLSLILPIIDYGSAYSNWLLVDFLYGSYFKELKINGQHAETYFGDLQDLYFPSVVFCHQTTKENTTFMVCTSTACLPPTEDFNEIFKLLP